MGYPKWFTKEELVLRENCDKVSIYELMKLLPNKSSAAIKLRARRLDLSTNFLKHEKYKIDYPFFEKLTPKLSHFIGFWWADGNLNLRKDRISFALNIRDKKYLSELFSQFSNVVVREYSTRPNESRAEISDKELCNILSTTYEFIPRKSLILDFPTYIDDTMFKYFVQGYFEGDGWIAKDSRTVGVVSGSNKFLEKLKRELYKSGFDFTLAHGKLVADVHNSYKFLQWIYGHNDTIKMERKYDLYKEIDSYRKFNENYMSVWLFSKTIGIHNQTLYNWLEKYPLNSYVEDHNGYKRYPIPDLYDWASSIHGKNLI